MAYRNFRRTSKPTPRTIVVKYAGKCACCGGVIKLGETATYYPAGARGPGSQAAIEHVAYSWDEGERVSLQCFAVRKQAAVNAYAGDGLDERYEDQCRDICGL